MLLPTRFEAHEESHTQITVLGVVSPHIGCGDVETFTRLQGRVTPRGAEPRARLEPWFRSRTSRPSTTT